MMVRRSLFFILSCLVLILPVSAQGLHLEGYCGDQDKTLVLVEYSALGWRCMAEDGELSHIDFTSACDEQYDGDRPYPFVSSIYNPYGVSCEESITTAMLTTIPLPPTVGGLDLGPYCQYGTETVGSRLEVVNNDSSDGYKCMPAEGEPTDIDMQAACDWMYPFVDTKAVVINDTPYGNACEVET